MHNSSSDDSKINVGGGDAKTLVLVGKTGNGKSATGNTIIGRRVFKSKFGFGGVTSSCQLETTVVDGGQTLKVIDTPGLFDSRVKSHVMEKEIARCIDLAKDGIHALLLVFSLTARFSEEEASVFESLCKIFGRKISDYMIVVFTHGDVLQEDMCLDDFLGDDCPEKLKSILDKCGNRIVVFDNKTKDEIKIREQRKELLSLVDNVVEKNGGKPYTNELFQALKEESRLKENVRNLEKQLAEERLARAEVELKVLETRAKLMDELFEMKERLSRAEKQSRELGNSIICRRPFELCRIM